LTGLHKALNTFWGGFSYGGREIPAYLSGRVPEQNPATGEAWTDDELFPYITYEVLESASFGDNVLTAFVWLRKSATADAARAQILDTIREAIPYEGVRIACEGGYIELFPNDSGFLSYYDDPESGDVLGARISYEIRFLL
jgi:hypothetical protein